MLEIGNVNLWVIEPYCDICAKQKISFMNETKRYEIQPRERG